MASTAAAATLTTVTKLLTINPTTAFSSLSSTVRFRHATKFRGLPCLPHICRYIQAPRLSTSTISATISVGDKLPESTFSYFDSAGELQTTTVSDLTKGKKAIFFAVPGAFTPTCSQKHLPGFIEKAGDLRARSVDTIACVSVNDAFVMRAWKESLKVGDEVLMLSDGNGEFTRALGFELDLRDKPVGLGIRSRRYALLADDGLIKVLNLEEGGAFTISSADDMIKALS